MAKPRKLAHAPIQEATIQFAFSGVELAKSELEALAVVYEKEGWKRREAHLYQASLAGEAGSLSVSTVGNFLGFVLTSPDDEELVHVRASLVAVSKRRYSCWEDLTALAARAFERYVASARPEKVTKISTRFINRIPPLSRFKSFEEILERPPLPIDGLEGGVITDFMRRHVIGEIAGGFAAKLTIGTVVKETDENVLGTALVIDSDVFKACDVPAKFEALKSELMGLRSVKNALFFGSLTDAALEEFV